MGRPEKIALFGGTFDPPHLGHLGIAGEAVAECGLDRVIFIPCRQSPHKQESASASPDQRCEMLRLTTADKSWAETSRLELDREGPSYSWNTAEHFASLYPGAQLHWILGQDQWAVIENWRRPDRLRELLTFIVFPRNEIDPAARPGYRSRNITFTHPASATRIRRLIQTGNDASEFLHPSVTTYIEEHRLYRAAASPP